MTNKTISQRYFSDSIHNYLVLGCGNADSYHYRMLAANRIRGVLQADIRFEDGGAFLFYDITARQHLKGLYEDRKMPGVQAKRLLYDIAGTGRALAEHLLDARGILWGPEYLYFDYVTERYECVYYPGAGQISAPAELFDWLMDHIDLRDKETAAAVMFLQEMAKGPNFLLCEDVLDRAYRKDEDSFPFGTEPEGAGALWQRDLPEAGDRSGGDRGDAPAGKTPLERAGTDAGLFDEKQDERHAGWVVWLLLILSVVFLLTAGALEILYFRRILQEPLGTYAGIGGAVFLVLAAGSGTAGALAGRRISRKEVRQIREIEKEEDTSLQPAMEFSADLLEDPGEIRQEERELLRTDKGHEKLYGTGKARRYHIGLSDLPCTVGTLPEFADILLPDPSVSGLHVRFSRQEDDIVMTDLNSTGGTYLNGKKLLPHESLVIHPEDTVRIGHLEFLYRP